MGHTQLDGSGAPWKRTAVQAQGAWVRAGGREGYTDRGGKDNGKPSPPRGGGGHGGVRGGRVGRDGCGDGRQLKSLALSPSAPFCSGAV